MVAGIYGNVLQVVKAAEDTQLANFCDTGEKAQFVSASLLKAAYLLNG